MKNINFLNQIKKSIQHHSEISKLKGEHFNIFTILDVESKENKTHSNFIAELLNPQGSHLCGSIFLELFLKRIGVQFQPETLYNINTEYPFNNGRIDIVIETRNDFLAIENKIYAEDQPKQILRYFEYASNLNKNYKVLYLTLNGSEASSNSKDKLIENTDYFPISYSYEILRWLNECIEKSFDKPILRETIKQYLILIKKLTGKLNSDQMEKDIKNIIRDNFDSSLAIANTIGLVKIDLINELFLEMEAYITNEHPVWNIEFSDSNAKWASFNIKKDSWQDYNINWSGNPYILSNENVLGVVCGKDNSKRKPLKEFIEDENSYVFENYKHDTNGWLCFRKFRVNNAFLETLTNKEKLKNSAIKYAEELISIAKIVDNFHQKTFADN